MRAPGTVIDISRSLEDPASTWPGDPPFAARAFARHESHGFLATAISMSAHCGTHLDLPAHVLPQGGRVGDHPVARFVLPALVVDWPGPGQAAVGAEVVEAAGIRPGEAVLLRTGPLGRLDAGAARALVAAGAALAGVEALSVDDADDPDLPAHHILLSAGMPILEGLDLSLAVAGRWLLVCPPLAAPGLEASPTRALLMR